MHIDNSSAAIDNDFATHLSECHLTDSELVDKLSTIFSDLGLSVIMHPLVFEKEVLHDNPRIQLLFGSGIISAVTFSDIFENEPAKKKYYLSLVSDLFFSLTGEHLPVSGDQLLTYWVRHMSLGEVHSFAMCLLCGCGLFLSDDSDSKRLMNNLRQMTVGEVIVYNRKELVEKHLVEGSTKLNRKDRQALTHTPR